MLVLSRSAAVIIVVVGVLGNVAVLMEMMKEHTPHYLETAAAWEFKLKNLI